MSERPTRRNPDPSKVVRMFPPSQSVEDDYDVAYGPGESRQYYFTGTRVA